MGEEVKSTTDLLTWLDAQDVPPLDTIADNGIQRFVGGQRIYGHPKSAISIRRHATCYELTGNGVTLVVPREDSATRSYYAHGEVNNTRPLKFVNE